MRNLRIFGVAALGLLLVAQNGMTQRGGAARGGVRGAVVGDMVGGESGAKVGAVVGATRGAINKESTARTQYQTTPEYQNATKSNFNEAAPEVLGVEATGKAAKPTGEVMILKGGKGIVAVTFPDDWGQKTGETYISAVSKDGHAYAMLATLEGADNQTGIKKVKTGLEGYLQDIKFDEPTETKGGASVITGTGKGKKAGVDVVFAVGVFDAGNGQRVGAAFIVDAKMDDHYKETIRGICQTLRRAADIAKDKK